MDGEAQIELCVDKDFLNTRLKGPSLACPSFLENYGELSSERPLVAWMTLLVETNIPVVFKGQGHS